MDRPQAPQRFFDFAEAAARSADNLKTFAEINKETKQKTHGPQQKKRSKDRLFRRMR